MEDHQVIGRLQCRVHHRMDLCVEVKWGQAEGHHCDTQKDQIAGHHNQCASRKYQLDQEILNQSPFKSDNLYDMNYIKNL